MSGALCSWMALRVIRFPRLWVRFVQTTHFARRILGCTSFGMSIAKCQSEFFDANSRRDESLTHEQCIKQACLLSVNSASTLLTTTSLALIDICDQYRDSLNKILSLLEEIQNVEGENPALWDEIVEARSEVNKAKTALTELNSFMEIVEKVVNATTEATFLAGAEYMCTMLCERLYSAQKEISKHITELKRLEEDYVKVQKEIISKKEMKEKGNVSNKSSESSINSQSNPLL